MHKTSKETSNYVDVAASHIFDLQNNSSHKEAEGKDENNQQDIEIGLKYPEISGELCD